MAIRARGGSRSFVGRRIELSALEDFARSGEHAVAYVHGLAGMGKSALVCAFADRIEATGVDVVVLDCRTIEPTERGLLGALGIEDPDGQLPSLLVLDHYEVFRLMDTWLRQVLVPSLESESRLVLAGREPPVAAWFSSPAGFRNLPLGPLREEDAVGMLDRLGVSEGEARRLNRIARGHPLALTLAAAGGADQPGLELEEAASGRVIAELARLYLSEVDDPLTRRALEAASVVRRTTEPLLAAMLDEGSSPDALDRLLDLPFVDAGRDGLVVHEAVRDAIGAFVRGTNPVRHRGYRRSAWRQLRSEVGDAGPGDLWRYTADMLYLIENPVVREAFFPSGAQPLAVEPSRPGDGAAIAAIAERHDPAEAATQLRSWWEEAPETFSVIRDRDGVVVGFFSLLDTARMRRARAFSDPVVDGWSQHLLDNPLPKGEVALGLRRWLDSEVGELPCSAQAACWLDVKRAYMALRPALRRMYVVVHDVPTYWPVVEKLGFRPIAEHPVEVGGMAYSSVALDFGPGSVDGWLADLVGAELGVGDEPVSDEAARELAVRGERVALTPLEYGLFECLKQREGKTLSRGELLRDVWGTDFTGGSNVVDAVVRSLRRKLGPAAVSVETVRGSGYRLRADWRAELR
jgi:hypothetical protein